MNPKRAGIETTVFRQALLALVAMLALGTVVAQDNLEREGYFEVRSASTEVIDGVHTLDARLQLVLSSEALRALESGVTLTIELQLQVIRVRGLLPDDVEAELAVRYELEYSPVTQRYIVRNLNPGDQDLLRTQQPGPCPGIARYRRCRPRPGCGLPHPHAGDAQHAAVSGRAAHIVLLARTVAVGKRMV